MADCHLHHPATGNCSTSSAFLRLVAQGWSALRLAMPIDLTLGATLEAASSFPLDSLAVQHHWARSELCAALAHHLAQRYGQRLDSRGVHPSGKHGVGFWPAHPLTPIAQTWMATLWEIDDLPPECLGRAYEYCLAQSQATPRQSRHHQGQYYTPTAVVDQMVADVLALYLTEHPEYGFNQAANPKGDQASEQDHGQRPLRILDLACGSGIFLLRTYEYLYRWHRDRGRERYPDDAQPSSRDLGRWLLRTHLHGVDSDPLAIAITRFSLALQHLIHVPTDVLAPLQSLLPIHSGNALGPVEWGAIAQRHPSPVRGIAPTTTHPPLSAEFPQGLPVQEPALDWSVTFPTVAAAAGFDVVLSNPPYVDSETMQVVDPQLRAYCHRHYHTASGNWDSFCVFSEQGINLCRPNGFVSMIVPNRLISAEYAQATRALLAHQHRLRHLRDYSQSPLFDAAVYPVVYITQKQPPPPDATVQMPGGTLPYAAVRQADQPWSLQQDQAWLALVDRLRQQCSPLGDVATVIGAATVADAYAIAPLIQDQPQPQTKDLRLINSGTIDRYSALWGIKRCRYLGHSYSHPVIPQDLLTQLPPNRRTQATQPKLIVASLTRSLECVADFTGRWFAAKSTTLILSDVHLGYLLAILNSRFMQDYITRTLWGNRLRGGYLALGPPQLKRLPIPAIAPSHPTHQTLSHLAQQLQSAHEQPHATHTQIATLEAAINHHIDQLYGVGN